MTEAKEKKEIDSVKIMTVKKPITENFGDLKKFFVKGGSYIKEKLTPKKNINELKYKSPVNEIVKVSVSEEKSKKIEIHEEDNFDFKVEEEEDEEEEIEDDDKNENKILKTDLIKNSKFEENKKYDIKLNLNNEFKNISNEKQDQIKNNFSQSTLCNIKKLKIKVNDKLLLFSNDDDDEVHRIIYMGETVDKNDWEIFPFKVIEKASAIKNLFSNNEFEEHSKFLFFSEDYLYGFEDIIFNKKYNSSRKIDTVIDLRQIYRILNYVFFLIRNLKVKAIIF